MGNSTIKDLKDLVFGYTDPKDEYVNDPYNKVNPPIKYCEQCGAQMISSQIKSNKFNPDTGEDYPLFTYSCPNLKGLSKLFVGKHDHYKLRLEGVEWFYEFYLSDCDF
jgi:hypothetical protein